MNDHSKRDHALWSASATARNVQCPGALTLGLSVPERSSIHADTGTAGHQISERCLRDGGNAVDYLGTTERVKQRDIEVDEELVNSAQEYIDYVRSRVDAGGSLQIEQRFSLNDIHPPFDAGGTGDAVLHFPAQKLLEVVDYKNGVGVVDVVGNPQLRTYGLGALLANSTLDVETIKVTIVQPRAPHKDGRIRSETFHVADLIDWTADLLKAMNRSKQAMDEHAAAGGNNVLLDEWRDKWLKPGKCTFCPVEGSCPALKRDALSVAAVWFDDMDQPRLGNAALDTDPASLNRDLNMIPMLEDWIKARRALAHSMAEQGVEFDDHMLVDKIGNRKWSDDTAPLVTAMQEAGVDPFAEPKLLSPAQLEKLLGSKRKALIEPFVVREVTGTNLVSKTKTTRSAAKSKAETYFEAQP